MKPMSSIRSFPALAGMGLLLASLIREFDNRTHRPGGDDAPLLFSYI
ncbi:MAG: hypothetical protein ACRD3O_08560 [Terriglobia bacterium]